MPRKKKGEPDPGYTVTVDSTLRVEGRLGVPLTLEVFEVFVDAANARGAAVDDPVHVQDHQYLGHDLVPYLSIAVPDRG